MDKDQKRVVLGATVIILGIVAIVILSFGLIKLGAVMFNVQPSLDRQSLNICERKGGTPVLEGTGQAYKSCAINGVSHTDNYVAH